MPGISAGGTRASSSTLIPSKIAMASRSLSTSDRHGRSRLEARRQRADVRDRVEMRELFRHRLRLAALEHARRAAEELGAQLRVGQRRIGVAGSAAWRLAERASVAQVNRHATPRLL